MVTLTGLAIVGGGVALASSWRDELPDPVATHWGPGNVVDGFSSLDSALTILGIAGGGLVILFGLITWGLGQTAAMRRIGAGATIWSALMLTVIFAQT